MWPGLGINRLNDRLVPHAEVCCKKVIIKKINFFAKMVKI